MLAYSGFAGTAQSGFPHSYLPQLPCSCSFWNPTLPLASVSPQMLSSVSYTSRSHSAPVAARRDPSTFPSTPGTLPQPRTFISISFSSMVLLSYDPHTPTGLSFPVTAKARILHYYLPSLSCVCSAWMPTHMQTRTCFLCLFSRVLQPRLCQLPCSCSALTSTYLIAIALMQRLSPTPYSSTYPGSSIVAQSVSPCLNSTSSPAAAQPGTF